MSLGSLLLAVFLILVGVVWVGWATISTNFLGIFALVTGIVLIAEGAGAFSFRVGERRA